MTFQFNSDISEAPLNTPLLLVYNKGASSRRGETGVFITQGIRKFNWYWEDYTGRQLWHSGATKSKNKILGWVKIEQVIYV